MEDRPRLSIIIVSWNVANHLARCLQALIRSSAGAEIIVIDNNSADDSVTVIERDFPSVKLIKNSHNRGFAAAVNQALAQTTDDVLLVNPDLEVSAGAIYELQQALERHPRAGIVGGKLVYPDGELQPSVKYFPTRWDLFLILSKIPNLVPAVAKRYNGLMIDYRQEQTVDQVMGSFFYIRKNTLHEVGMFDEQFFIWFEEVDYCRRAQQLGWTTLYTPQAIATHQRGASFAQRSVRWKQQVLRKSIVHYVNKYFGLLAVIALIPAWLISWGSGWLLDIFQIAKPHQAKHY